MLNRISFVAAVITALTLAGAAWSWSGVGRARTEVATLETRLGAVRTDVAKLAALPAVREQELPPLAQSMSEFLAGLPTGVTVKSAGQQDSKQDSKAGMFQPIPNLPGGQLAALEITDAHSTMDLPIISLAAAARWQRRWPLQVSGVVWTGRGLVTKVTLYGR